MSMRSVKAPAEALYTHLSVVTLAVLAEGAVSAADLASVFDCHPATLSPLTFVVAAGSLESDC